MKKVIKIAGFILIGGIIGGIIASPLSLIYYFFTGTYSSALDGVVTTLSVKELFYSGYILSFFLIAQSIILTSPLFFGIFFPFFLLRRGDIRPLIIVVYSAAFYLLFDLFIIFNETFNMQKKYLLIGWIVLILCGITFSFIITNKK